MRQENHAGNHVWRWQQKLGMNIVKELKKLNQVDEKENHVANLVWRWQEKYAEKRVDEIQNLNLEGDQKILP